jgi:hypothetical protein
VSGIWPHWLSQNPAEIGFVVLVVVGLFGTGGWYLSYLAGRLDRLHHRVEASRAALEAQLARRATAALDVARLLAPPDEATLISSATRTLGGPLAGSQAAGGRGNANANGSMIMELPVSEPAENELTRALHQAFADPRSATALRADPASAGLLDELVGAGERVQLARRFHNDAVAHTLRIRRKRIVRWARLAGRAALPEMVEIDDSHPIGLNSDPPSG